MRTCSKCSQPLEDDAKICPICGQAVQTDKETKVQPTRTMKFTPLDAAPETIPDAPAGQATRTLQFTPETAASAAPQAVPKPADAPKAAETKPAVAPKPATAKPEAAPASVKGQPTRVMNFGTGAATAKPETLPSETAEPEAAPASVKGQPTRVMNFGTTAAPAKPETAKPDATPASVKGQPTRVLNFGSSAATETKPVPTAEAKPAVPTPVQPKIPAPERPVVIILRRLFTNPRFLVGLGVVVAGLIVLPWGARTLLKPATESTIRDDFNAKEIGVFDKLIDEALPEKLEWGRDIMHRRLLSRFPEELLMEVDKKERDVKYEDKQKTRAYYRFLIAYHFKEEPKESYTWKPVTFFFKLDQGKWVMMGDRWLREDEVQFE